MFLLGFTSLDIILFAQIFRTSTLTEKKDFRHEFSFLTDRLNPPPPNPLNGQNPLSVTKVFCRCSVI